MPLIPLLAKAYILSDFYVIFHSGDMLLLDILIGFTLVGDLILLATNKDVEYLVWLIGLVLIFDVFALIIYGDVVKTPNDVSSVFLSLLLYSLTILCGGIVVSQLEKDGH